MPQDFDNLNNKIVYTKVKSRGEATKLKDDAIETVATGKTVVIFFDNKYNLYLAPGNDPYQIRREIDAWMNKSETTPIETPTTTTKTKPSKSKLKT